MDTYTLRDAYHEAIVDSLDGDAGEMHDDLTRASNEIAKLNRVWATRPDVIEAVLKKYDLHEMLRCATSNEEYIEAFRVYNSLLMDEMLELPTAASFDIDIDLLVSDDEAHAVYTDPTTGEQVHVVGMNPEDAILQVRMNLAKQWGSDNVRHSRQHRSSSEGNQGHDGEDRRDPEA